MPIEAAMAEHADVQRIGRALEVRNRATLEGDVADLLERLFAAGVVWHGAAGQEGDEVRGADRVTALWNAAPGKGGPRIDVREVYADGLHGVASLEWTADGGRGVPQAMVFHLDETGAVDELWSLPTDEMVAAALDGDATVPEHPHLAVFRTAEETRARNTFEPHDLERLNAFLREDVRWLGATEDRWSEAAAGREQVIGLFQGSKQATGGTIRMELHGVFADDTHALSFVTITADRPDKPGRHMDLKEVNLFHLDADGRAFEFWGVPNDPEIMDAFWAP
jgi:ketosteroid isomerase-like protein